MTNKDLQQLIIYINRNVERLPNNHLYNEKTGNYDIVPCVNTNQLFEILGQYPTEEPEACSMPNYEAMYNDILLKMEAQNDEIERLKKGKQDVELRLARATGAIAMIELLYGRKWMAW